MRKIVCKDCKRYITHIVDYWEELEKHPENIKNLKNETYYRLDTGWVNKYVQDLSKVKKNSQWFDYFYINFVEETKQSKDYYLCEECYKKNKKWINKFR